MVPDSSSITIYHIPRWRSTRAVWCYQELLGLYDSDATSSLPRLHVHEFDPNTFRTEKPDWYLKLNPNGKVPFMVYGDIQMFDSVGICCFILQQFDKGTVDNLTASSSPVQMVVESKAPRGLADYDHKGWSNLCGPLLSSILGEKQYFFGDEFTAIDVIVGMNCMAIHGKTDGWLEEFPNLSKYYHERIAPRSAFKSAISSKLNQV